jgi:hypothetical protein
MTGKNIFEAFLAIRLPNTYANRCCKDKQRIKPDKQPSFTCDMYIVFSFSESSSETGELNFSVISCND